MRPPRLVLASASPRRRQLLELLGIPCRIEPADLDETRLPHEGADAFALRAARDKALAVAARIAGSGLRGPGSGDGGEATRASALALGQAPLPVLAADTVVEVDGIALGKPRDGVEAAEMLRRLSGRAHRVHTGVALAAGEVCEALVDTAAVRFLPLDEGTIAWYVASGEPMDKAGAYAVQGRGGLLVDGVDGSPNTVIGLPLHRLPELFSTCGLDFWSLVRDTAGS